MSNEFTIDFNKLEIADSEYDRDYDDCEETYIAVLEYGASTSEQTDRFQYEIMKRAGLDNEIRNDGIEIDSFEKFQELCKDKNIQLKIELLYSEFCGSDELTANALCGERSYLADISLNEAEREQLEQFRDTVLSKDKELQKSEYDKEMDDF